MSRPDSEWYELMSIIRDSFNCAPDKEIEAIKEAGVAMKRLGKIVHLVGRDWDKFEDIPEQIEYELIERIVYSRCD